MKYKIWNRQDKIRGIAPELFLSFEPFKNYNGDIILILNDNNIIVSVENKKILSEVYNIDENLPLNDFMEEYFEKKNKAIVHTDSQNGEYYEFDNELQEELAQSNEDNENVNQMSTGNE